MANKKRTAFDKYFDERIKDNEFAREYATASAEINTIDRLIVALDEAREAKKLSKSDLARRIGAKPEIIRRMFTVESPNPTFSTILNLANALDLDLRLVPKKNQRATERGRRFRYSEPSLLTSS